MTCAHGFIGACAECDGSGQMHDHADHGGDACNDDGAGRCGQCGVGLSECDACGGRGYHRAGCAEIDG